MFRLGPSLGAAGFDAMLPVVSTRRPRPQLRLLTEAVVPSQVGVQQLSNVRWTVLFDDLELDAAGIAALAKEAKPSGPGARSLGPYRPGRSHRGGVCSGRTGRHHPALSGAAVTSAMPSACALLAERCRALLLAATP